MRLNTYLAGMDIVRFGRCRSTQRRLPCIRIDRNIGDRFSRYVHAKRSTIGSDGKRRWAHFIFQNFAQKLSHQQNKWKTHTKQFISEKSNAEEQSENHLKYIIFQLLLLCEFFFFYYFWTLEHFLTQNEPVENTKFVKRNRITVALVFHLRNFSKNHEKHSFFRLVLLMSFMFLSGLPNHKETEYTQLVDVNRFIYRRSRRAIEFP